MPYKYIIILFIATAFPCLRLGAKSSASPDTEKAIKEAIIRQTKTYPELTLQDIYKSFFQDSFGPGHLISDTVSARQYLHRETSQMGVTSLPYYEPAGSGRNFYRVSLALIKDGVVTEDEFFKAFIKSAEKTGLPSAEDWKSDWEEILSKIPENTNNYTEDRVMIDSVLSTGNYAVHHSRRFNKAYNPHYRLISKEVFESELLPKIRQFRHSANSPSNSRNLDEVVVTGSNDAVGRNLLPYTVSIIGKKQIEATGSTQLLSAVSGLVPSLFVSERNIFGFGISNGGSGGIKIRGVGGSPTNAVLMMVDGQPQFAGIYSHHVADSYGTENVERVEVLRGPASVLYGSNAMGGVINVITRGAEQNGIRTTLTSQYGSYNTWLSSLTNTAKFGRFSSLVSLGYDRTDGTKKNFDFRQTDVNAKIAYEVSDFWNLRADYSFMQFVGNDPIYPTLSNPESTDIYHQNIIRGEGSVSATNRYANTNGAVRIYYSYGNHFVDDPRHFHSLDDRFGIIAYQNFKPWTGANATVGFDFDRYTGQIPISGGKEHTDGSLSTISRKGIKEYSPYITLAQNLWGDRIILNAGIRMANSDKFDTEWIPQAGFVVHPGAGWTVKASIAKGYRNPSFREMYLYRMANPDLQPEKMINYEATIGRQFNRWFNIDLTAYFCKGTDMIQTVDMKNVNTGSFINKGIEVAARSHPLDCLQIWATYSYLHTSLSNLTAAPKNQYYLGIGWDAFRNFHADAELKGVGGMYVADDIAHEKYVTVNLRMTYQVIRQLQLFVNLDNITDTRYAIMRGYTMPGFSVMGGFRFSI